MLLLCTPRQPVTFLEQHDSNSKRGWPCWAYHCPYPSGLPPHLSCAQYTLLPTPVSKHFTPVCFTFLFSFTCTDTRVNRQNGVLLSNVETGKLSPLFSDLSYTYPREKRTHFHWPRIIIQSKLYIISYSCNLPSNQQSSWLWAAQKVMGSQCHQRPHRLKGPGK